MDGSLNLCAMVDTVMCEVCIHNLYYTRYMQKKLSIALIIGFIAGMFWLVAVRFISYKSPNVHYHANFGLFVNGQRDEFKSFTFYEEVQSCGSDELNNPKTRVHMHDQKNHVAHVHDNAVTWGDFFANLGYGLTNKVLQTDAGVYLDGQNGNELSFLLNGEEVSSIANVTIRSEDVLLVNYGKDSDETLNDRYGQITKDADRYNQTNDPSSCSGSKPLTFGERLRHAIGIGG